MADQIAIDRLQYLIDHYMETRTRPAVISTAMVARAVRALMPACPLMGRELEDAIGEAAVRYGHVVQFDLAEAQQPNVVPERALQAA